MRKQSFSFTCPQGTSGTPRHLLTNFHIEDRIKYIFLGQLVSKVFATSTVFVQNVTVFARQGKFRRSDKRLLKTDLHIYNDLFILEFRGDFFLRRTSSVELNLKGL